MAPKLEVTPADAVFIIEGLQHVTTPIVINVGEIARAKGAKLNTIQKRFSELKKRYDLKILTTSVSGVQSPAPPSAKKSSDRVTKPKTPSNNKKNKSKPSPAKSNALGRMLENDDKEDDNEDEEESPSKFKSHAMVKVEEVEELEVSEGEEDVDPGDGDVVS